jgi:hypothetical protein
MISKPGDENYSQKPIKLGKGHDSRSEASQRKFNRFTDVQKKGWQRQMAASGLSTDQSSAVGSGSNALRVTYLCLASGDKSLVISAFASNPSSP